jgi:CO/xanthine dehydrogenase Mo-binding subunit
MVSAQAVFAEVDVDTETGDVFVKNLVAANDCGTAINPMIVEGQMFGGNLMGVGIAIHEEKIWYPVTGYPIGASSLESKLSTFLDYGTIDASILVQPESGLDPYSASGPSEATPMSTKPAIQNAIYNAIGTRIFSIPQTPDKILKALGKA